MSRLEFFSRPLVAFDANNKQHRKWFAEFKKNRAWGSCPVRFIVPDANGTLLQLIHDQMLQHYVEREFGEKRPK